MKQIPIFVSMGQINTKTNPLHELLGESSTTVQRVFLLVGIDPGVNTGMAIWDARAKQFTMVATKTFWSCIDQLVELLNDTNNRFAVFIENPKGVSGMYDRHEKYKGRVRTHIAQSVGGNKRDAQLLTEWCERNKICVFSLTPGKNSMTKMTKTAFAEYTGYAGSTSSHSRDAAMLVFNREPLTIR